ncbi:MAG: phosphoglucomutase/phosphomannomutase family protein [Acidobacteriota bacterium]
MRFGTDGWRGRIGFDFNVANLRLAARATAEHFLERGLRHAFIGYDRRFLSKTFARHVGDVFEGQGLKTLISDSDLPTPALSWSVASHGEAFGVMITASHNPPEFNGFKIKQADGSSIEDPAARDIEARWAAGTAPQLQGSGEVPTSADVCDLLPAYLKALAERVDIDRLRSRDWTVVVDSMHGCGGNLLEQLLAGGKARVHTVRNSRDVMFGGTPPEPTPEHLGSTAVELTRAGGSVGLATDGDADRLGAIDEHGEYIGSQILTPLLALHLIESRGVRGALAKTYAHTLLLDRIAEKFSLDLHVTPIGFKHLAALMRTESIVACGEESGGIGVAGFIPERDGLLAGLLILEALCTRDQTLAQAACDLRRRFGDFHYRRIDLRSEPRQGTLAVEALASGLPSRLAGHPLTGIDRLDGLKCLLGDDGWILFRQSGTESVLRVYAEVRGRQHLDPLLEAGVEAISRHLPSESP